MPEQHSTSSSGWGDTTSNEVADVIGIVAAEVVILDGSAAVFVMGRGAGETAAVDFDLC